MKIGNSCRKPTKWPLAAPYTLAIWLKPGEFRMIDAPVLAADEKLNVR